MIPYGLIDCLMRYWIAANGQDDVRPDTDMSQAGAYLSTIKTEVLDRRIGSSTLYPAWYDPNTFISNQANLNSFRAQSTQVLSRRPEALPQFRIVDPWTIRTASGCLWPAQTDQYIHPNALSLDGSVYPNQVWMLEPLCLAYEAMLTQRTYVDSLNEGATGVLGRVLHDMITVGLKSRYVPLGDTAGTAGFVVDGKIIPEEIPWIATALWALLYWESPGEIIPILTTLENQMIGWCNRGLPIGPPRWAFAQAAALLCMHGKEEWRPVVESYVRMLLGRNNWRIHGLSLYMPSEPGGEDLVSTNQMGYMARMLHFAARISIPGAAEALRWMGRQFFRHMIVVQPDRPVRLSATIGGGSSFPSLSSGDGCGLLFGLPSSWAISYHDSYASQKAGRSHQEPLTSRHFETTWIGMLYHEAHGMWVHYKALDRFAPFLG